jgi:AraC-like DNA-binding protein
VINGRAFGRAERVPLRAGAHTVVFHHVGGQTTKEHAHPGWNVVIPRAGHIRWNAGERAAGVVFPPQVTRQTRVGDHVSVFIDAWYLGLGTGPGRSIPLDRDTVECVRALWFPADGRNPDELAGETVIFLRQLDKLPRPAAIDPRVEAALTELASAERINDVAASVRLSPSRLRALICDQIGTPPARLRMWLRLRAAILSFPNRPIALAAFDAGFADQAHLTRTATQLVGQTPGEIARRCAPSQFGDDRTENFARAA